MRGDLIRKVKEEHAFWPGDDAESRAGFYDNSSENFLEDLTKSCAFHFWFLFSKCFCKEKSAP